MSHVPARAGLRLRRARSTPRRPAPRDVAGPGFRDFTRIAQSDPELWGDILTANRKALAAPLAARARAPCRSSRARSRRTTPTRVERRIAAARAALLDLRRRVRRCRRSARAARDAAGPTPEPAAAAEAPGQEIERDLMSEGPTSGGGQSFAELFEQRRQDHQGRRGRPRHGARRSTTNTSRSTSASSPRAWFPPGSSWTRTGRSWSSPATWSTCCVEEAEDEHGRIVLSKEKADRLQIWDEISRAYEADEPVEGVIVARVKGGLSVDIGVKAFLPGSQVDLRPVRNLEQRRRPAAQVQDHQVQQEARQHRALAARAARDGAQEAARDDAHRRSRPARSSTA